MPTLGCYVSDDDYNSVAVKAKANNMTVSKYVKQCVLSSKVVDISVSDNIKLQELRERQRFGVNLTQIAKYCNPDKGISISVLQKLVELERLMNDR